MNQWSNCLATTVYSYLSRTRKLWWFFLRLKKQHTELPNVITQILSVSPVTKPSTSSARYDCWEVVPAVRFKWQPKKIFFFPIRLSVRTMKTQKTRHEKDKGSCIFFFNFAKPSVKMGFLVAQISKWTQVSNCRPDINTYNLTLLPETLPSKSDKGHSLKLKTTLPPATPPALYYVKPLEWK